MRHDHDRNRLAFLPALLQHGGNTNGMIAEYAGNPGKDPGLIRHHTAQVIAGGQFFHRANPDRHPAVHLKRGRRHAPTRLFANVARNVDHVTHDRASRRQRPRPLPVKHDVTHGIAHDVNGVIDSMHLGQRRRIVNHGGMHAGFDAILTPFRHPQQFHRHPQLRRVANIQGRQALNAFGINLLDVDGRSIGQAHHDGQLVRGIDSFDIERRVRLRVAGGLCLRQGILKFPSLAFHLGQDIIGGAVHDAGQRHTMIGRQSFGQ